MKEIGRLGYLKGWFMAPKRPVTRKSSPFKSQLHFPTSDGLACLGTGNIRLRTAQPCGGLLPFVTQSLSRLRIFCASARF